MRKVHKCKKYLEFTHFENGATYTVYISNILPCIYSNNERALCGRIGVFAKKDYIVTGGKARDFFFKIYNLFKGKAFHAKSEFSSHFNSLESINKGIIGACSRKQIVQNASIVKKLSWGLYRLLEAEIAKL
jgi:hypothetical protein